MSVTQPCRKFPMRCDACKLPILDGEPVVFALQESGCGPYPGQPGWYTATAHAHCAKAFLAEYEQRPCRGCGRTMWTRPSKPPNRRVTRGSHRSHCSNACRQADYRRRRQVVAEQPWLMAEDVYWLTRPTVAS